MKSWDEIYNAELNAAPREQLILWLITQRAEGIARDKRLRELRLQWADVMVRLNSCRNLLTEFQFGSFNEATLLERMALLVNTPLEQLPDDNPPPG